MYTREFMAALTERCLKTFAQTFLSVIVVSEAVTITDVDWTASLGAAALAAVLSALTSIASSGSGGDSGPSAGGREKLAEPLVVVLERGDG